MPPTAGLGKQNYLMSLNVDWPLSWMYITELSLYFKHCAVMSSLPYGKLEAKTSYQVNESKFKVCTPAFWLTALANHHDPKPSSIQSVPDREKSPAGQLSKHHSNGHAK